MKKLVLLGLVTLLLAASAESFAQGRNRESRNNGRLKDRQDSERILPGIRSGQITRDDRRNVRRGEREQDRYIRDQHRDDERRRSYNNLRNDRRRGNGYYRRGAGSPSHPVFGVRSRNRHRNN